MSIISAFPGGGAEIEGNALPANVDKGVTFMSANSDEVQTGTRVPQGTATPARVLSGYTFQSAASEALQTGTYTANNSVAYTTGSFSGTSGTVSASGRIRAAIFTQGTTHTNAVFIFSASGSVQVARQLSSIQTPTLSSNGKTLSWTATSSHTEGTVYLIYVT